MILYIVILAVLVGLDQLLKYWTVTHLALGESAPLLPGVMRLTRLHNYGAAWSSLSGKTAVLLVVTLVVLGRKNGLRRGNSGVARRNKKKEDNEQ